jgi:xylulokinase
MSLMGIDIGTTGCKVVIYAQDGKVLSHAYTEYDIEYSASGSAELDTFSIWPKIRSIIQRASHEVFESDPVSALSTSSLGEAVVPVSGDRRILGSSILMNDPRGNEFIDVIRRDLSDLDCFRITGNPIGAQFGFTKLMWLKRNKPKLYDTTYKFLNWGSFVAFMLGAEPRVDYSLANRSLLFDIVALDWSDLLIKIVGLDREKLPACEPAGSIIGRVTPSIADEMYLAPGAFIVNGGHDQCVNALGCGVVEPGKAMYDLGTFPTIMPIHREPPSPQKMVEFGLNLEHHVVPNFFISLIYHMGGSLIKWYRDTFAQAESRQVDDIYSKLFAEVPDSIAPLFVLPNFSPMGPPDFISNSCGVILGLRNFSKRADILKSIVESNNLTLKVSVENLASIGVDINSYRAVGGMARSDVVLQISADILNSPIERTSISETGTFGAAILAGSACGYFGTASEAAKNLVSVQEVFYQDRKKAEQYAMFFSFYKDYYRKLTDLTFEWNDFKKTLYSDS